MKKIKLALPHRAGRGPLTDVEKRLEDFSFNLYFSYVFDESVKTHQKLQDDYIDAFLEQDHEQMENINLELALVESAFEATACMLDASKEEYS
jgi:hypothetical protein|tara:strand:- start:477 stop:755 length:279 start_codon:yes stop_codon:yes gene_type:complete